MSLARVSSPRFIGRDAELGHLLVALEDARGRRCIPILVAGEAGIGKTRLVSKFLAAAAGSGDAHPSDFNKVRRWDAVAVLAPGRSVGR